MTGIPALQPDPWMNEGQSLASLLDNVFAAVVAGTDANAASSVAIGIARAQGMRRRVAIADLVGESPPLEALYRGDDPHGIADSFLYGVSLNKIARQVNEAGTVFLMPSGTESVAHEAVYANERWRRLAAGFHQVGALLLVVAVPGTPGFAELCGYIGALLPVGDTRFPMPAGIPIIAAPAPSAPTPPPAPPREKAARAREAAVESNSGRRMKIGAAIVALGAVAVAIGAAWPQIVSRLPDSIAARFARQAPDTTVMLVKPTAMDTAHRADSVLLDSAQRAAAAAAADSIAKLSDVVPMVANPADSTAAARYSIQFISANSSGEALADARLKTQPAVAVSPVMVDGVLRYRVFIGASPERDGAEILLAQLRSANMVISNNLAIVPFALRLEGGVSAIAAAARIVEYQKRGIQAYALQQPDGNITLYTGAFETPRQAIILADSLRKLGRTPVLAYRTGRSF
jgi:hypothetical protein